MTKTIHIQVPRRGIGSDLTERLGARGLHAEIVESDNACTLRVSFAEDEVERLLVEATHTIEAYLSERMLPLIVQRANGGCIVRPPAE
jgi:hypothetical protein